MAKKRKTLFLEGTPEDCYGELAETLMKGPLNDKVVRKVIERYGDCGEKQTTVYFDGFCDGMATAMQDIVAGKINLAEINDDDNT